MKLPIANKIKKKQHLETGLLQDEIIDIIYDIEPKTIFHGGTSIWRCYNGNRFSEDIDMYLPKKNDFKEKFIEKAKQRSLNILKFKETSNLFFAKISNGLVEIRLEMNFSRQKKGQIRHYEKIDGSFTTVISLSPEELLKEKILAYKNRRFIRDIYDVFHLLGIVEINPEIRKNISKLLTEIKEPIDENNLKTIVYSGAIPSFKQIIERLKGYK